MGVLVSKAEGSFDAAFSNVIDFNHTPSHPAGTAIRNASILVPVCHQLDSGMKVQSVWTLAGTDSLLWKGAHDPSPLLPTQAVLGLVKDVSSWQRVREH